MKKKLTKSPAAGAISVFLPIVKVDAEQRLVYGTITEEVLDKAGEVFDYEGSKPYFQAWSQGIEKATGGKSKGNVRVMHTSKAVGKVTDLVFDDEGLRIEAAAKIVDDDEWKKVEEGVYTGFSIGGRYVKRWKDGDLDKFIADPVEVSIVDNPAVPTATFQLVKADGVEVEVPFKIWQPENSDVAKRATVLAEKVGKSGSWVDFVDEARAQLIKEHSAGDVAAAAKDADVVDLTNGAEDTQISISECNRILASEEMDDEEKMKAIRALAGAAPEVPAGFTPEKVRSIIDDEDMDDSSKSEAIYAMIKEEDPDPEEEEAEEEGAEDEETEEESDEESTEEEESYKASEEELESAKANVAQVWKSTDGRTFTKKNDAVTHQAAVNAGAAGEALTKAIQGLRDDLAGEEDGVIEVEPINKALGTLKALVGSESLKKYMIEGPYLHNIEQLAAILERLAWMVECYNPDAGSAPGLKDHVVSLGALLIQVSEEAVANLMASMGVVTVEAATAEVEEEEVKEAFATVSNDRLEKAISQLKPLTDKTDEAEVSLQKAQADATEAKAEAARLRKIVDEAVPAIEELRKQVQELRKTPGPQAHRGVVVSKEQDNGGAARPAAGVDEVMATLQKMTPEERATLAIKVAQSTPISAMNRGEKA